jgi:hypothetical protein
LPLWWFARRLRSSIELDCDARVLRKGVDVAHYADVLLQVGQRRLSSPYAAATLIEPVTQLERRVRIMLTRRAPNAALRAAAAAALALAIAACATRVEPPAIVSASAPLSTAPLPTVEKIMSGNNNNGIRIVKGPGETMTIEAAELILQATGDVSQLHATVGRIEHSENVLLFGDGVTLEFEGTSVKAASAVATQTEDGRMTLTLKDAVVTKRGDTEEEP